ncbi:hypothetical protein [Streptomyces sp. NPDC091268]|uniref:hypothetical protein n=1 Tax=Streptomyces sp. NPDC091268 TaxID=3365979 RepID=UPI0037F308EC
MTRGIRPPARWVACAALLAATLSPCAPAALAATASLAPATPADSGDVDDGTQEAYEELAGSAAGVGRERPGRPAAEPPNPEAVLAARPVPVRPPAVARPPALPKPSKAPSPPDSVTALGSEPNERAADLAAHILPLGTGFALMGLGLGFMGMRLRKGG